VRCIARPMQRCNPPCNRSGCQEVRLFQFRISVCAAMVEPTYVSFSIVSGCAKWLSDTPTRCSRGDRETRPTLASAPCRSFTCRSVPLHGAFTARVLRTSLLQLTLTRARARARLRTVSIVMMDLAVVRSTAGEEGYTETGFDDVSRVVSFSPRQCTLGDEHCVCGTVTVNVYVATGTVRC
jgi:hypothetical protein